MYSLTASLIRIVIGFYMPLFQKQSDLTIIYAVINSFAAFSEAKAFLIIEKILK